MLYGFTRKFKPLEILSEEQVWAIHRGTLDVLFETGIRIEHEKALRFLKKNGCKVDFDNNRVHFPPGLVEECLRQCPSSFRIKARDPKKDWVIGRDSIYFEDSQGMQTIDLDTLEPRSATRKEYYDGVKVLDALEYHHKVPHYTPYFGFRDIPPVMAIPEGLAARIRNSSKLTGTGYSNDCEMFSIKMANVVGSELITFSVPSPPLTYYSDAIEAAYRYVEADFPILSNTCGILGGTYPSTIAGSLVIGGAEVMAIIVLVQLLKPGTRMITGTFSYPQNMKTGSPAFGDIGVSLHNVAFNQVWRKYGIPIYQPSPGYCSGKIMGYQTGYEKGMASILSALSGANIIQIQGGISSELTFHPIMAILDDDIAGMVGRFVEGVRVSYETLAIDLINEVGPIPGFYLDKEHTRKWWKNEQFVPRAADRLTYPEWMKTGKKNPIDYAKERMDEILATHKVNPPLSDSQEEDIESILKEAREFYRKKGLITGNEWEAYKKDISSQNYPYA